MSAHRVGRLGDMMSDLRTQTDYTIDGKCSECGACCGNILPISKREFQDIKQYVEKNNIKPHKHFIAPVNSEPEYDMSCPFLDTSKEKNKCLIYSHRPYICRTYSCHNAVDKAKRDKAMFQQRRYITDMRAAFFGGKTFFGKLAEMGEKKP